MTKNTIKSIVLKLSALSLSISLIACTSGLSQAVNNIDYSDTSLTSPLSYDKTPKSKVSYQEDASTWPEFKQFLIQEAKKQGFSNRIIAELENLTFNATVIRHDKNQYERILENRKKQNDNNHESSSKVEEESLMANYIHRHISQYKVKRAKALVDNYQYYLNKFSEQYQVAPEVIIGLWGMETNFGKYTGNYDLLDSLASLAYEGRRRVFFTREFFNALRVMEINNFEKKDMLSSWAGAVGQIQFMPTSYLLYAVDGNEDGNTNIWISTVDSLASIASYLHKEGWNPNLPWGLPIQNMDFENYLASKELQGINIAPRSLADWKKIGYKLSPEAELALNADKVTDDTLFWLVVPTNEPKLAHLVTSNYKVYMHWNRSMYFAFTNGVFADQISNASNED